MQKINGKFKWNRQNKIHKCWAVLLNTDLWLIFTCVIFSAVLLWGLRERRSWISDFTSRIEFPRHTTSVSLISNKAGVKTENITYRPGLSGPVWAAETSSSRGRDEASRGRGEPPPQPAGTPKIPSPIHQNTRKYYSYWSWLINTMITFDWGLLMIRKLVIHDAKQPDT